MMTSASTEKASGYFDYERWDVYQAALDFIIVIPKQPEESVFGRVGFSSQFAFSLGPCLSAMIPRSECKF